MWIYVMHVSNFHHSMP